MGKMNGGPGRIVIRFLVETEIVLLIDVKPIYLMYKKSVTSTVLIITAIGPFQCFIIVFKLIHSVMMR